MRIIKRAFLSTSHQMKKTIIILSLIFTVSSMIMIGLSIKEAVEQASQNAKNQMRAEVVVKWNIEKTTSKTDKNKSVPFLTRGILENIKKVKDVTGVSAVTRTFIRTNLEQIQSQEKKDMNIQFNNAKESPTNYLYGIDSLYDEDNFQSKNYKLIEGVMPYNSKTNNPVIVSSDYAKTNNLKIGSVIKGLGGDKTVSHEQKFTVSGIFKIKSMKYNKLMQYDDMSRPDNNFYTTTKVAESIAKLDNQNEEITYNRIKININRVDKINSVIKRIKKDTSIDWSYFSFISDFNQYERITSAINSVAGIATIILWIACLGGIVVLFLSFALSLNNRKFEMGVLLSMGENKLLIIAQVVLESFIIFIFAFVLSTSFSSISANKITDNLISRDESSTLSKKSTLEQNTNESLQLIGQDDYQMKKINEVKTIKVNVKTPAILVKSFILSFSIIFLSTITSTILILRKDPKTIMIK